MRHASIRDLKAIFRHFQAHRDVFPHIRQDVLKRRIEAHQCIYQNDVAIAFQTYKKLTRVGEVNIPRGSVVIHQIVNGRQFSGAGSRVFKQFVEEIVQPSGGDLYLSVRKQNKIAREFYERHRMEVVGTVAWKKRTIPGLVYRLRSSMP